ncbi:MAG: LemA family protein, partial [Candidatus Acidiferrales bacterium]
MKAALAVIAVLLILALIFGSMYAGRHNQMVRLNEDVKSKWAQVDVVLQRRADLIPNLVATVQGFAAHEQTVFDDIAKARTQYMNAQTPADKIAASNQIAPLELKILALSENYPQLKS